MNRIFHSVLRMSKLSIYKSIIRWKVYKIRKKKKIKVLFVLSEISSWKTESLYLEMQNNDTIDPILGVSTSDMKYDSKTPLIYYLNLKKYDYIDLDSFSSIKEISPDIIIYGKPYPNCYSNGHFFDKNLNALFLGFYYGFHITKHIAHMHKEYYDYCWQYYVENDEVADVKKQLLGSRAGNIRVTGVPFQDLLLQPKDQFSDPWKDKSGKKRIIYAPHHSIKGTNFSGIEFSTFLDYADEMVLLAKKYQDKITIAFKPHPSLYKKLIVLWGKQRADEYYELWDEMPNTQLVTGDYISLFKYSDAIIHDCASFIIEYLYMDKPGLYLMSESNNVDDMLNYVKQGLDCYKKGYNVEDIKEFIINILRGDDHKASMRKTYIRHSLTPPGGISACQNIINSILNK